MPFLVGIITHVTPRDFDGPTLRCATHRIRAGHDRLLRVWMDRTGRRIPAGILCALGTDDHHDRVAPARADSRVARRAHRRRSTTRTEQPISTPIAVCRRRARFRGRRAAGSPSAPARTQTQETRRRGRAAPLPDPGDEDELPPIELLAPRPRRRTPMRARPNWIGWARSCSRRSRPSRWRAPSPGVRPDRW